VIGVSQQPGTIMAVSLRLLYLIIGQLLRWLALLGRTTSSKEIELLLLRHDDRAAASGPVDLNPGSHHSPSVRSAPASRSRVDTSHYDAGRGTPRTCSARAPLFDRPRI
jgi:hypothetical protein